MHAPESITPLSFPVIFYYVSQELPLAVGGDVSFQTETSLYYIKDPSLRSINGGERAFLEKVTARDLGVRLSQLINSYFQLTQLSLNIIEGSTGFLYSSRISQCQQQPAGMWLFSACWMAGLLPVWPLALYYLRRVFLAPYLLIGRRLQRFWVMFRLCSGTQGTSSWTLNRIDSPELNYRKQ